MTDSLFAHVRRGRPHQGPAVMCIICRPFCAGVLPPASERLLLLPPAVTQRRAHSANCGCKLAGGVSAEVSFVCLSAMTRRHVRCLANTFTLRQLSRVQLPCDSGCSPLLTPVWIFDLFHARAGVFTSVH